MFALVAIILAFAAPPVAYGCTTPSGSGTCRDVAKCPNAGGTAYAGYCPGPTNIQCCVPKTCTTPSGSGVCKPTSECSTNKVAGYCPGPSTTQCCITSGGGGSTSCTGLSNPYGAEAKSACTGSPYCWTQRARWLHAKIQACHPNIECTTYASDASSDHAGNGLDCWSKSGRPCPASGSIKTDLDRLAAWATNLSNAQPTKIGYVNWVQRQWSQGRSGEGWRSYASRGSCTANHYDHVHISVCAGSYNPSNYGCT